MAMTLEPDKMRDDGGDDLATDVAAAFVVDPEKAAEAKELVEMEMQVLEAVLGDELVAAENVRVETHEGAHKSVRQLSILVRSNGLSRVCERAVVLDFELSPLYPFSLPSMSIETHGHLRQAQADELYGKLLDAAAASLGEPVILDLVNMARDFVVAVIEENARVASKSTAPFIASKAIEILGLLSEEGCAPPEKMREGAMHASSTEIMDAYNNGDPSEREEVLKQAALAAEEAFSKDSLPLVSDFISITDLFRQLPPDLAILKIESIMRHDIAKRFADFRAKLAKRDNGSLAKPEIMYHGTSCHAAASIVRTGLLPPGKRGVKMRNGAAFGDGIYMGAFPSISLAYCDRYSKMGSRLFVCAVLKGAQGKELVHDHPEFCVLANAEQVLPLYVVHCTLSGALKESYLAMSAAGSLFAVQASAVKNPASGGYNGFSGHYSCINNRLSNDDNRLFAVARESHREAAIKNAELYFDTRRYKVLDVAPVDEDDDQTQYVHADSITPIVVGEDGGVEACGAGGDVQTRSYQLDRVVYVDEDAFVDDDDYGVDAYL